MKGHKNNMNITELTKSNFDEKVAFGRSLVDFWAAWCGPCRAVAPIIDEVAKETAGRVNVYKVNVDNEGELAARFEVMSIPTIIIFDNGKEVNRFVGVQSKAALLAEL
jgi:thioredoxin 1